MRCGRSHAREELEKSKSGANASVRKLVDLEGQPFVTQRTDFVAKQDEWMRKYHNVFYPRVEYYRHRDELHVMATVRTYFQFAYEVSPR